jgi:uncharacterized protein YigE (DUF2233 family)
MKTPLILISILFSFYQPSYSLKSDEPFRAFIVDVKNDNLKTYWKNARGEKIKTLSALQSQIDSSGHKLLFAMNCGMYTEDNAPVGLYIENGKKLSSLKKCNNTRANFCLQPQGVFYITNDKAAGISTVDAFTSKDVAYAIEAAPMVVIDSKENTSLPKTSAVIRNGAGIRSDGKVILAISIRPVTFPEFARYFIEHGCTTAVYFDGVVSRAMVRDHSIGPQLSWSKGRFGAMIAVTQ